MEKSKVFDRELTSRCMTTALEAATEWTLFGLRIAATAQNQALRSTRGLLDQTEAALEQSRKLTEELIDLYKKFAQDLQRHCLDSWSAAVDAYKVPDLKPAGAEKKSA